MNMAPNKPGKIKEELHEVPEYQEIMVAKDNEYDMNKFVKVNEEFHEMPEYEDEVLMKDNGYKEETIDVERENEASRERKQIFSHNSMVSLSETNKSMQIRDSYDSALEDRFRDFLKNKLTQDLSNVVTRIQLLDQFEREIRDEIRNKFLTRAAIHENLVNEIRRANEE